MTCLNCNHGALKDATNADRNKALRGMAKSGFINCLKSDQRADFFPFKHECPSYEAASAETQKARETWAAKEVA